VTEITFPNGHKFTVQNGHFAPVDRNGPMDVMRAEEFEWWSADHPDCFPTPPDLDIWLEPN
jgi:hypothetical protein